MAKTKPDAGDGPQAQPSLQQLVAADRAEREAACGAAIDAALKRYQCRMLVQTIITGPQVEHKITIVANGPD